MSDQHTVRPGEVVIVSSEKRVVTSKHDLDGSGRMNPVGLEEGVPTIVGAAEGAAIAKQYANVELVSGNTGVLPTRFKPEAKHLQDAFVGRHREPSREQKVKELLNAGVRPISLADSAQRLIDAGWTRDHAVEWARTEYQVAIRSGTGLREPWIAAAKLLLEKK